MHTTSKHAGLALLALLAITTSEIGRAQTGPSWQRDYQGPGPGPNTAGQLAVGPAGEVYLAMTSSGAGGTASDPQLDALVQKFDPSGALLWSNTIDLGADEFVSSVHYDSGTGALYAVGGATPMSGTATLPRPWYVWRLDPLTGAIRWTRSVSGPAASGGGARGADIDAGGGLVVAGYLYPGTTSESDVSAVRFAPDGTLTYTWVGGPSSSFDSVLAPPAHDPAGGVLLSVEEAGVYWLRRLDANGASVWSVQSPVALLAPLVDGASNVVTWSRRGVSGSRLEKRDALGGLVYSLDDTVLLGAPSSVLWLDVDSQGFVHVLGDGMRVARVSPAGQVVWNAGVPASSALEVGLPRGVAAAANGDTVALGEGYTVSNLEFLSVARWDVNGTFRWAQGLLGTSSGTFQNASDIEVAPSGAVLVSGTFLDGGPTATHAMLASLFDQSAKLCLGDGSAGPCPCGNESNPGLAAGCASSALGVGARLEDFGVASLSHDTLRLVAQGISPLGPAVLVQSATLQGAQPLGDGLLCVGTPFRRLYVVAPIGLTALVPASATESLSARSALLGDPLAPGASRYYQLYYRTASALCGGTSANLTNAVRVTWSP